MALKTDYKDDVLDVTQNEKRKYRIINNDDGSVSLEDVTVYLQNGDSFGAKEINEINQKVNETAGNVIIVNNVSVPVDSWQNSSDYTDYPQKALIIVENVTENYVPDVTFNVDDANSGMFAPVAKAENGSVTIYAKEQPSNTITVLSIVCVRGN